MPNNISLETILTKAHHYDLVNEEDGVGYFRFDEPPFEESNHKRFLILINSGRLIIASGCTKSSIENELKLWSAMGEYDF